MSLIQTDAAINSGNSGGALFNMYGEVVGITNAKYGSSSSSSGTASIDNIGFAIPIDDVRSIVESIIENGYIVKPYVGVSVTNVSSESQQLGLPQGAAVAEVVADSPAEASGLQVATVESVLRMPHFVRMAVKPANSAEPNAYKTHIDSIPIQCKAPTGATAYIRERITPLPCRMRTGGCPCASKS